MQRPLDDDRVITLVEMALSFPKTERDARLKNACADDTALMTQVQHYVEWEDRMGGFLLEPLCLQPVLEHRFAPGEVLQGRFRIIREVAQGGMGIVYEAEDEKLKRRIALKCGKAGFRQRLPPEVRHAREISHPNVCKIFDIHTTSTPQGEMDFLTMEFLDGETLADRLDRGPLSEPEARSVATQLCAGLAEAHRNRVIHGDLKSQNVILTTTADGATRAVITDFGLAQGPDASTRAGGSSGGGTPAYMAPELWQGVKPSISSDIYALGVTLHEMVSGKRPPVAKPGETRVKLPSIHPKWDPIVSRCLDLQADKRFQSAEDVAQALEPYSRRWFLAAVAAILLAAITGLVTYEQTTAPKETIRLALLPFASEGATGLPASLLQEATDKLSEIRSSPGMKLVVIPASSVLSNKIDAPGVALTKLGATHVLHGTLTEENGALRLHGFLTDTRSQVNLTEWTADYAPGLERHMPVALAGMITGTLRLPPLLAKPTINAAAMPDYVKGLAHLRRNSEIDSALADLDRAVAADPDSPLTHAALAEAQWFKYFLTGESQWLDRTSDSVRQAQARNPDLSEVHRIAGLLKHNAGLYEAAKVEYVRAIELNSDDGDSWRRLGQTAEVNNQSDEALAAYRRAIDADPEMYRNYQALGTYYNKLTRYREAAAQYLKAAELVPGEPAVHYALGIAYVNSGRFAEAEEQLRSAIAQQETPAAVNWLGLALMYQSKESEAVPHFLRALQLKSDRYQSFMDLGICYRRMNRPAEALSANLRGLELAELEMTKNPRDGNVRASMAYLAASLGDKRRAESEIRQALLFSPNDIVNVHWLAVLTYEMLGRRDDALALLRASSSEFLGDIGRWPDLADLHRDSRFKQLLASRPLK